MTVSRARLLPFVLLAACLDPSGAGASNNAPIKSLGLEVHFTQCTDSAAEALHLCGKERWNFKLDATGWRSEHANSVAGVPGRWTATCKDGAYEADIGGKIWSGSCEVTGDEGHLCLKTESAGVALSEPGGGSEQCFTLSPKTC